MHPFSLTDFIIEMIRRIQDDDVPALGAQLTFYLILSFFPFLIFLLTLLSYTPLTREEFLANFIYLMPTQAYDLMIEIIQEHVSQRSQALLSIGMVGTIWAASRGVMAIIKGINKAYDIEEHRSYLHVRGIAILYTLGLAIVVLVSFVMVVFGKMIGEQLFVLFHVSEHFETTWNVLKTAIPLGVIFIVFLFVYKGAPNRKLSVKEVLPGTLFTTVCWVLTSILFAFYVNNFSNYTRTYGSIGGVIILLVWMYFSNIIIILGGEVNAALTMLKEGKKRPGTKQFGFDVPFQKLLPRKRK